jgi:polyisoprenyl-phosphate glycosyltransferase
MGMPLGDMKLSIVVPVYKEERAISPFLLRLIPALLKITPDFEIIFSLDPSPDATAQRVLEAREKEPRIKLLEFSRRFGQPMATLAGMQYSAGDAVIVMDVDLQDPPELIEALIAKWREGFDVVYGKRSTRQGLHPMYRLITYVGYKFIQMTADKGIEIPANVGDFRLMSRRVVDEVLKLKESHGFLRGLVALVGFKQTSISFERGPRSSGKGNYNPVFGSLRIGLNGLVCFSAGLLQFTTAAGFAVAVLAFIVAFVYAVMKMNGVPFPLGNPTIVILVLFLGGIQLISVGILGEYIGRIYDEVKQRPRYIVSRAAGWD